MKSYKNLYAALISDENIEAAIRSAAKGAKKSKKKRRKIRALRDDPRRIEKVRHWIEHYYNDQHTPIEIYDGTRNKKRTIIVPTARELVVQHALILTLTPLLTKGMYEHTYASLPKRGAHKGKRTVEKWIRRDPRHVKYMGKADVRKFFESIPRERLMERFCKYIRDDRILDLIEKILDAPGTGLPLGFYTSQWFANWYLQPLDHYIKEELGIAHSIRYMDDIVIADSNKRKVHKAMRCISEYLIDNFGLSLKENTQIFRFVYRETELSDEDSGRVQRRIYGRDLDFMGFRFFRNRTIMRRHIMLRASRKARRIAKKEKPTIYELRQMLSYMGYISHTDTYGMYERNIKPFICIQYAKRRISRYDKRKTGKEIIAV